MLRKSFKKAACRDGSPAGRLIEKIIEERPDLASETFYVPERGQMAVTVMTSSEVFKSPISMAAQRRFYQEIDVMKCLSNLDMMLIPKLTFVSCDQDWIAMERKPGETSASWDVIAKSGSKLGAFKAELEEQTMGLKLARTASEESFVSKMSLLLASDEVIDVFAAEPEIIDVLKQYVDKLASREASVSHDDWNTGNMLFHPETGDLTAVIDYGMAEYTVFPEQEIIRMSDRVPREYYKRFVEGYVAAQTRIDTQDIATYGLINILSLCLYDFREEGRGPYKADFAHAAARWLETPMPSVRDPVFEKMRWGRSFNV